VTITGSGFELGAGVTFEGQSATSVAVNGDGTQISAITPTGPLGLVDVVMTNPDNTVSTLTNGFTYTGPPPSIVTQPVSLMVAQGSSAVFQVGALYAGAYQWQMNGGNLTDNGRITGSGGSVLTIPGAQLADSGNYQVSITNAFNHESAAKSIRGRRRYRYIHGRRQREHAVQLSMAQGRISRVGRDQPDVDPGQCANHRRGTIQRGGGQFRGFGHQHPAGHFDRAQLLRQRPTRPVHLSDGQHGAVDRADLQLFLAGGGA
jgi:hypothetical protein